MNFIIKVNASFFPPVITFYFLCRKLQVKEGENEKWGILEF